MSNTEADLVAETVYYIAVRRLQNTYADIVTRRAWAELPSIMDPGCTLSLDLGDRTRELRGPGEIAEFISGALERFSFFEFVVLNSVVDVNVPDRSATSRLYMTELRQNVSDGRRTNAFGVYHDAMSCEDGTWRFLRRHYASYSRTAIEGPENEQVVFDLPVIPLDAI